YAFSVECYQAQEKMSLIELRKRVERRMVREEQLVVSPAFFSELRKRIPEISRIRVRPKRGNFDNEMTRFRFDATLHVGDQRENPFAPDWIDGSAEQDPADSLPRALADERKDVLAIRNIPNGRIEMDRHGLAILRKSWQSGSVGELRAAVSRLPRQGIDP